MGFKTGFQTKRPQVELSAYESVRWESFDCSVQFPTCLVNFFLQSVLTRSIQVKTWFHLGFHLKVYLFRGVSALPFRIIRITRDPFGKWSITVANECNSYFSSVGSRTAEVVAKLAVDNHIICSNSFIPDLVSSSDDCFKFTPVGTEDVRRVILSLPLNRAPGPDKARVFKDALQVILGPITEIINCSLGTSTFPSDWKIAEVIPLPKEGDHEEPPNNRPFSLLNVASKVCEKIVLGQFITYLISRNRLSSHQSGNKSLHSTETLNIYTTDLILEAMDKKEISTLVLLGFSKAFDSICHQRLLQKLSVVGASPAVVQWFRSYLSDRTQSVRIDSVLSDPLPVTHGVFQGAILSPLLFCIYLNDLPGAPQFCQVESYADDSKVLLSFPVADVIDAKFKLEEGLRNVATWCCTNDLLIDPEKTKFM